MQPFASKFNKKKIKRTCLLITNVRKQASGHHKSQKMNGYQKGGDNPEYDHQRLR